MPDEFMFENLWPFRLSIDAATLAGVGLWALAFYLGFSPVSDWVIEQLSRWFNFAERSLYTSTDEYEKSRSAREAVNTLYASLLSIIPFLMVGGLFNYGIELGLGRSWAISVGLLACIGAGIYELGRRDGQNLD
jgi:ABC-type Fe3+ transport system permease subunit